MKITKKCVRYACFPDTKNGFIGFYEFPQDGEAIHPRLTIVKNAESARTHVQIDSQEKMDAIAQQVGAKTRKEFPSETKGKPWLNAYSRYLSEKIGAYLEKSEERGTGLLVHVCNDDVDEWLELSCPAGKFVIWPK